MNTSVIDALTRRLTQVGKSGRMPIGDEATRRVLEELQQQIATASEAGGAVLGQLADGPNHTIDGDLFMLDGRPTSGTYNVLSTTEAARNGLPSANGFCVFRHGRGIVLNRYDTMLYAVSEPLSFNEALGSTASATQPERTGGFIVYSFDNHRTVFQFDVEAQAQKAVAIVACFSSFRRGADPTQSSGRLGGTATEVLAANTKLEGP